MLANYYDEKLGLRMALEECLGENVATVAVGEGISYIEIDYDKIVDYLFSQNVTVPPVDVGDSVWYIEGGYYNSMNLKPREITVTEISKKKCGKTIDWAFIANRTRYRFSSLGKVVFLNEQDCIAEIERRKKQRLK
jgi:hypothetical protein